jgi:hypothetical protein
MSGEQPGEILVPNLDGTILPIVWLEPSEAVKVVGVHQAMDGNMTAQVAALTEKATRDGFHGTWPIKAFTQPCGRPSNTRFRLVCLPKNKEWW